MGLLKKGKSAVGNVVSGASQATGGVVKYSSGSARRASGDSSGVAMQKKGVEDIRDGTRTIVGLSPKKKKK